MKIKRSARSYFTLLTLFVLFPFLAAFGASEVNTDLTAIPCLDYGNHLSTLPADAQPVASATAPSSPPPPSTTNLGRVAYVHGGDIWLKALPDGEAQRLTSTGTNSEPRWAPSGQWIAYRSNDQVGLIDSQGEKAHVLNSGDRVDVFAWAPTEDRLAYVTGTGELWTVGASDSTPFKLAPRDPPEQVQGRVGHFAWGPDGAWIACDVLKVLREGKNGKPPERSVEMWRIRTDGHDTLKVYDTGSPAEEGLILADWAPGAQGILFWPQPLFSVSLLADGVHLHIISVKGGKPRELTQPMLLYSDFLSNSPQGELLAVTEGRGRETWTNKHIAIIEVPGGKKTVLTDNVMASISPSWSPGGQLIAYVTAPDIGLIEGGASAPIKAGLAERRIAIMNLDGSVHRQLTHDQAYRDERPLWSTDGSTILFARLNEQNQASLWLVSLQDDEPFRVVDELMTVSDWADYFGHINWTSLFDWWRGD